MKLSNYKWALLILVLHAAAVIWFATVLPADARVPIHWNIHNQIDGWTNRATGLFWGLGLNAAMFLLLWLMPAYSPWFKKYRERYDRLLPSLTAILLFFFALISVYALYVARWGEPVGISVILILMGFLFIFLGNLLPKVPKNFFIGIKTPWSLASDEVWDRTHRLGGLLFVLSGLLMIAKGFFLPANQPFQVVTAVIAFGMLLYPILHSFILYKKLGKN